MEPKKSGGCKLVIAADDYREILGARFADGEDGLFWSGLFQDIEDRGRSRVQLAASDGHRDIQKPWIFQASSFMKNTHHAKIQELAIGKDLSCMDQLQALINQKLEFKA